MPSLKDYLKLTLLIVLTCLVYAQALNNPFLGVEVSGLLKSSVFTDLDKTWNQLVTPKGVLHKPLSMLTFAWQFDQFGREPYSFHLFNLFFHCLNTFLIWQLARKISIPATTSALVFALHPLQTSVAALIFGRPYLLGTFFMLIALNLIATDKSLSPRKLVIVAILWIAMFLSKQVFVVFPLLLAWLAYANSERNPISSLFQFFRERFYLSILAMTCAAIFIVGYAIPYSKTAYVGSTTFGLSQLGNLPTILYSQFLVPWRTSQIHALPWYNSFFEVHVIFGFLLFLLLLTIGYTYRKNVSALLLIAFFILLLPTNSIFPKDQVVVEWRFYPAMVAFALFIGSIAKICLESSRKTIRLIMHLCLVGLTCVYLKFTVNQIKQYGGVESSFLDVLEVYPESLFALNDLGNYYLHLGDLKNAEIYLRKAEAVAPMSTKVKHNLRFLESIQKERLKLN